MCNKSNEAMPRCGFSREPWGTAFSGAAEIAGGSGCFAPFTLPA